MIMECLEINVPLSNIDKYIELTDIIIPKVIEKYNENLPIKIHIDSSRIQEFVGKIKSPNEGQSSIIKTLIKREIKNFNPKEKKNNIKIMDSTKYGQNL